MSAPAILDRREFTRLLSQITDEQKRTQQHFEELFDHACELARQLDNARRDLRVAHEYVKQLEADNARLRDGLSAELAQPMTQKPGRA